MGIARFATLSDGSHIVPLNSFKKHQQRLARYQRAMSRKVKFSNNWKKAKARVQRIHTRIANARKDFLHKASCQISQNHAMIAIEDLQVRNMSKSAKGNSEQHGKMVKQKSGLNRSILDPDGANLGGNWSTSRHGMAASSSPCRRNTPARLARAVGMCRKTTGRRKPGLSALSVALKKMPMLSARSIF